MLELYKRYPRLGSAIPRMELVNVPTPVEPLDGISRTLNRPALYIKRDDLTAIPYGGNKVRKLEFLFADARMKGARRIITSGAAGSNHALATAIYSRQCGFACTLMLFAQPPAPGIDRQLLADVATGAKIIHDETYADHCSHLVEVVAEYTRQEEAPPYVIPAGGSNAIGVIGYVNAAFELVEQIERGDISEPSAIYVTMGTMGTVAGLLLGCSVAGLASRVVAVRVVPEFVANRKKLAILFNEGNQLLHNMDSSFPLINFKSTNISCENNYFGNGYGVLTPQASAAIQLFSDNSAVTLDPVYTGKTAAAFIDASTRVPGDTPLLFWHTKSAHAAPLLQKSRNLKDIPPECRRYFKR